MEEGTGMRNRVPSEGKEEPDGPSTLGERRIVHRKSSLLSVDVAFKVLVLLWLVVLSYFVFSGYKVNAPELAFSHAVPSEVIRPMTPLSSRSASPSSSSIPIPSPIPRRMFLLPSDSDGTVLRRFLLQKFPLYTIDILKPGAGRSFETLNGTRVSSDVLQQGVTFFVYSVTTRKLSGMWDAPLYTRIFEETKGNCVWVSIMIARASQVPERPLSPQEDEFPGSGVNLLPADSKNRLEKVLQFHMQGPNVFHEDAHNVVNLEKLEKLLVSKNQQLMTARLPA